MSEQPERNHCTQKAPNLLDSSAAQLNLSKNSGRKTSILLSLEVDRSLLYLPHCPLISFPQS